MRIEILGAGIIGLSVADELIRRGHDVVVVDPAPGRGASYAAAGMISPSGELWHGEDELFRLGASVGRAVAGVRGAARACTSTTAARCSSVSTPATSSRSSARLELLADHDVKAEPLDRRALRELEPGLGRVTGGALLPDDHSVDPRAVVAALLERIPVLSEPTGEAADVRCSRRVPRCPSRSPTWCGRCAARSSGSAPTTRLEGTVRGWVHGEQVYVVPRRPVDGVAEVVIGATSEEHDATAAADGRAASPGCSTAPGSCCPASTGPSWSRRSARDRPGSPDNLPLIGPDPATPGLLLAAGHFRHGVLLAPLTARLVADHLDTGAVDAAVDPRRFDHEGEHR